MSEISVLVKRIERLESLYNALKHDHDVLLQHYNHTPRHKTESNDKNDDDDRDICFGCGEYVDDGVKHMCYN